MSWRRPVAAFAGGAAVTLGSTVVSCALALQVEASTHRLFFWLAPHWYAKVDRASGLSDEDLQYAHYAAIHRENSLANSVRDPPRMKDRVHEGGIWRRPDGVLLLQAKPFDDDSYILDAAPL
jgi:hypothetical protein